MSVEIKMATLEPVRHTFTQIAKRFGDKPASRYQEATYDIQAVTNFHYKPSWDPQHNLNDASRTAIQMADWYVLKDPRQFYYATYVASRARMQDNAENNYSFFEKRQLAERLSDEVKNKLIRLLVPLRHVEHTANLNNIYGVSVGFGTALTQALVYEGMDRLGIAQYLSRIGLILDGNTGTALEQAKQAWMEDSTWQRMRALCEELLVQKDWFEVLIAQDLVMDTLTADLYYRQFDCWLADQQAHDVTMLLEFMQEWQKDRDRWLDSTLKLVASESDSNRQQLLQWANHWSGKVAEALAPIAMELIDGDALSRSMDALATRLNKLGIK
ncbi:aromatic/alkene monooxygenase hydroxylase subunit beta [Oceanobacter mangrovi]|uniref:aromatic/alkene monooxygenase hydroxylase subunit beta n=1 Tax=Oceanobacter mangrovi TaxID=2862510 RepID=UPI001C8D9D6D|nr:aromatic/alkene monooxygenase hydroxylase subunit beta [Oceanobacter mangrovi]